MPTLDEILKQQQEEALRPKESVGQTLLKTAGLLVAPGIAAPLLRGRERAEESRQRGLATAVEASKSRQMIDQQAQEKIDDDPTSETSKQAQAAFLKSTQGIANALKIPNEVMQTYVSGRSRKQLKTEDPTKVLLDIAKLNAENAKARKAAERDELGAKRLARLEGEDVEKYKERSAKDFENDKVVKKSREQVANAATAVQMLDAKNPVGDEAVKTFLARASGEVGVLTDRDVARFGGSKALMFRINQSAKQLVDGKLTDQNRGFLKELANTMSQRAEATIENRARSLAKQRGKIRSEVPENELLNIFGYSNESSKGIPNDADIENMSDEELKRYIGQ